MSQVNDTSHEVINRTHRGHGVEETHVLANNKQRMTVISHVKRIHYSASQPSLFWSIFS